MTKKIDPLKNFDRILWKETLWVNLLRAFCALPILIIFSVSQSVGLSTSFFIFYPFLYILLAAPLLILLKQLIIAIAGEMAGVMMIFVMIPLVFIFIAGGDPIVFLIKKLKPDLIPLESYPFICLDIAIFVLKNDTSAPSTPSKDQEYIQLSNNIGDLNLSSKSSILEERVNKRRKFPFVFASILAFIVLLIFILFISDSRTTRQVHETQKTDSVNESFSAIAFSKSTGKYGGAWNHKSFEAAQSRAMQECGVIDCESVLVFQNSFGAFAQADDTWGGGSANTQAQAEQMAIQSCKKIASNPETCEVTLVINSSTGFTTRLFQSPPARESIQDPLHSENVPAQIGSQSSLARVAIVFDPPSNIRKVPDGEILCSIQTPTNINIYGSIGSWYHTNICGTMGVIHSSQIKFQSGDSTTIGTDQTLPEEREDINEKTAGEQVYGGNSQSHLTENSKVAINGIGPVRVGMTVDEASQSAHVSLIQTSSGGESQGCFYFKPENGLDDVQFMVTQGRISRVDIFNDKTTTFSGAKIGDSENRIMSLYSGRIQVQPHEYVQNGHYLVFTPKDQADQSYRVIFETDGDRVTSFRAGKIPEVTAIEGCL